ncbi:hypothetical protein HPB47_010700 [Ixodes persulcatus]|uniref:Uncharacterized protein n=1 Tax=Ixodes persulcatus TaxID=34615 RepID=A0AC60NYC4_IXOPE|nr:hypothetical protein HPB47_010700 [Ixodes persulcatus]
MSRSPDVSLLRRSTTDAATTSSSAPARSPVHPGRPMCGERPTDALCASTAGKQTTPTADAHTVDSGCAGSTRTTRDPVKVNALGKSTSTCDDLSPPSLRPAESSGRLHHDVQLRRCTDPDIRHFPLPPTAGSPLDVWPTYKLSQQLMHIPAGLVNASVPSNSTFFALHLSRLGTRFFAALSKLLYDSTVYELETPLRFTPDAQAALDRLLDCIVQDARPLFGHHQDPSHLRLALLEQVLAIQLAFLAFRQLLGTRRIWKRDFRLAPLPNVSSDKLFFIYYALDHCELSDDLFSRHEIEAHRRLPAKQRVNVALRQSPAFARAFSCQAGAPMTATSLCQVLR